MLEVVAQVERDDLGGAQPIVSLEHAAGPRGAELLALAQYAFARTDGLLAQHALVVGNESGVGVEIVGSEVAHRRAVRQNEPPARNLQDDQIGQDVRQRTGARLLLQQLERLHRLEPRLRIELDPGLDGAH